MVKTSSHTKPRLHVVLIHMITMLLWIQTPHTLNAQTIHNVTTQSQLENAINNSGELDIIRLQNNMVITTTIEINQNVIINGNGYSISPVSPTLNSDCSLKPGFNWSMLKLFKINNFGTDAFISNLTIIGGASAFIVEANTTLRLTNITIQKFYSLQNIGSQDVAYPIWNKGDLYLKNVAISRNENFAEIEINNDVTGKIFGENISFVENFGNITNRGMIYLNNCTFANNTLLKSNNNSAAINNISGAIYICNGTFTGNRSTTNNSAGAIYNHSGVITLINCIFAYNYNDSQNSSTDYCNLNDIVKNQSGLTNAYSCIFHQNIPNIDLSQNCVLYTGDKYGTDNTLFSDGILVIKTNTEGFITASNASDRDEKVYRPFTIKQDNGTIIAPLRDGGFAYINRGITTCFLANSTSQYIGYKINNAWVTLSTTLLFINPNDNIVTTTQGGSVRSNSTTYGSTEKGSSISSKFKINIRPGVTTLNVSGHTVGATYHGEVYTLGASVSLTAVARPQYKFTHWQYRQGGTGVASIENPCTVILDQNITLEPIFVIESANVHTLTYDQNGASQGSSPSYTVSLIT